MCITIGFGSGGSTGRHDQLLRLNEGQAVRPAAVKEGEKDSEQCRHRYRGPGEKAEKAVALSLLLSV